MATIFAAAAEDPRVKQILEDLDIGHFAASDKIKTFGHSYSESAVRRYRKWLKKQELLAESGKVISGSIDVDAEGATINNVVVNSPIQDDWSAVFELFNLNPANFDVVDDTVKMSTWQQSKGAEDGTRDSIQLYSYSARFRRITREPESQEALRKVHKSLYKPVLIKPLKKTPTFDCPTTYKFDVADPQLGKIRTAEAVENWKRGVTRHLDSAADLSPTDVHVAFQGDETENVFGHYGNQPVTVELNQSEQEQLDLEMRIWTVRQALELGIPVSVSSVISNHGERRTDVGGDPLMSRGDNGSTKIARMAKMHFDLALPSAPITWHIASDSTPFVTVRHSGILSYYSHGYVEQGKGPTVEKKLVDAIEKQILGRPEITDVRLIFLAHYHHAWSNDQRGRTFFGDPALEALKSSEWVLDRHGQWSWPGMLGMLVGNHSPRKYSHVAIH